MRPLQALWALVRSIVAGDSDQVNVSPAIVSASALGLADQSASALDLELSNCELIFVYNVKLWLNV